MAGYLFYPAEESGYDLAARFPAIHAWRERIAALPRWKGPYELLPGERIAPKW
jgi:glutathione S-transferase